jgi:hypothetical protein
MGVMHIKLISHDLVKTMTAAVRTTPQPPIEACDQQTRAHDIASLYQPDKLSHLTIDTIRPDMLR